MGELPHPGGKLWDGVDLTTVFESSNTPLVVLVFTTVCALIGTWLLWQYLGKKSSPPGPPPPVPPPPPLSSSAAKRSLFSDHLKRFFSSTGEDMKGYRKTVDRLLALRAFHLPPEERHKVPVEVPDLADLRCFRHVLYLIGGEDVRFSVGEIKELQECSRRFGSSFDEALHCLDETDSQYNKLKEHALKSASGVPQERITEWKNAVASASETIGLAKERWMAFTHLVSDLRARKNPDATVLEFSCEPPKGESVDALTSVVEKLLQNGSGNASESEEEEEESVKTTSLGVGEELNLDKEFTDQSPVCPLWLDLLLSAFDAVEHRRPRDVSDLSLFIQAVLSSPERYNQKVLYSERDISRVELSWQCPGLDRSGDGLVVGIIRDVVYLLGGHDHFRTTLRDWFRYFGGDYDIFDVGAAAAKQKERKERQKNRQARSK